LFLTPTAYHRSKRSHYFSERTSSKAHAIYSIEIQVMKFSPLCLFTIICGYSLVIAAPISQSKINFNYFIKRKNNEKLLLHLDISNLREAKHQNITAIASRLLKELANEHLQQIESNIPQDNDKIGYLIITDEESSSEGIDVDQELMKYLEELQL
jgi:hypothetical protein